MSETVTVDLLSYLDLKRVAAAAVAAEKRAAEATAKLEWLIDRIGLSVRDTSLTSESEAIGETTVGIYARIETELMCAQIKAAPLGRVHPGFARAITKQLTEAIARKLAERVLSGSALVWH